MESKGKVPETTPCPTCGKDAVLTHWSVPEGIDPNLRQYQCPRKKCRTIIYMYCGPYPKEEPVQTEGLVTQGPDIFHPGGAVA